MNVMRFSKAQLENFAEWEPVELGYDRDADPNPEERLIRPLILRLSSSGELIVHVLVDAGLANHVALFVHYARLLGRNRERIPGVAAYLSLLAPVGVFGRTNIWVTSNSRGWKGLSLSDIRSPANARGRLERAVLEAIASTPYTFLDQGEVGAQLPEGIRPYEYCLCDEPWDRVFHVMFSATD